MKNRRMLSLCAALGVLMAGLILGANRYETPTSIIHVVTIQWKAEAPQEQRRAALEGVKKMAREIPGITRVWIRATRVQPQSYHDAFVIEFRDKAAAEAYADHPAHRAWEAIYIPIRAQSTSHQITN